MARSVSGRGYAAHVLRGLRPRLEEWASKRLRAWPTQWEGYHWPGYIYEHTLRVAALGVELARREGANEDVVWIAAMLHDIRKDDPNDHAALAAEEALGILTQYGIPSEVAFFICDAIAKHAGKNVAHSPPENRVLADADLIDTNFGLVAVWRYITIRAGSDLPFRETLAGLPGWLPRTDALLHNLLTQSGREVARQRAARMRAFCEEILEQAGQHPQPGVFRALDLAAAMHADCGQHSLADLLSILETQASTRPADPSVIRICKALRKEIAGEQ